VRWLLRVDAFRLVCHTNDIGRDPTHLKPQMKTPKISNDTALNLFRQTGGRPHRVFNEQTRKYEKFVHYENGQTLGPFLTLPEYKKAAVTAYVQKFRVLPEGC